MDKNKRPGILETSNDSSGAQCGELVSCCSCRVSRGQAIKGATDQGEELELCATTRQTLQRGTCQAVRTVTVTVDRGGAGL